MVTDEARNITLLRRARECVARGEQAIARQEGVVARRRYLGVEVVPAEALLSDMYAWQLNFQRVLASLEESQPPGQAGPGSGPTDRGCHPPSSMTWSVGDRALSAPNPARKNRIQ